LRSLMLYTVTEKWARSKMCRDCSGCQRADGLDRGEKVVEARKGADW
jgi:hypothetical protein